MNYDNLIGMDYKSGVADCYGLMRKFYDQCFDIKLPNFARPVDFHKANIDLFGVNYFKVGFYPLDCHPTFYMPGDVVLMAIRSKFANHCGVLVENGKLLHHLLDQRSTREPYSGLWRQATLNVYRHKNVSPRQTHREMQFIDLMPRRKNAIIAATNAARSN